MDEIKADKTEITETKAIIENLNSRVKQMAELQKKITSTLQNDKHSVSHYDHMTKNEFSKQIGELSNQAQILSSFINNSSLEEPKIIRPQVKKKIKVVVNEARRTSPMLAFSKQVDDSPNISTCNSPKKIEFSPTIS